MADIKWIKLSVNMFDDEKIKLIRTMPEGDSIALIWIQILCLAGKINDGGLVYMGQNLAYSDEMLATILGHPLNIMRVALQTLEQFDMIDISADGKIDIMNWEKHQNIDGMERVRALNAERNKKYRERKKQKQLENSKSISNDVAVTSRDGTDIDIDTEIDKDIELYSNSNRENEELSKISDFYQKNIGVLAPNTIDDLLANYKTFGYEMVIHALTLTVDNQANYGYTKGIFNRWLKNNTRTMDDVRAAKEAYERKQKANSSGKRKGSNYQEPVPESMKQKYEPQEEVTVESEAELRKRLAEVFKEE